MKKKLFASVLCITMGVPARLASALVEAAPHLALMEGIGTILWK